MGWLSDKAKKAGGSIAREYKKTPVGKVTQAIGGTGAGGAIKRGGDAVLKKGEQIDRGAGYTKLSKSAKSTLGNPGKRLDDYGRSIPGKVDATVNKAKGWLGDRGVPGMGKGGGGGFSMGNIEKNKINAGAFDPSKLDPAKQRFLDKMRDSTDWTSVAGKANINQAPQEQFRSAQMGLMGQLQGQVAGEGPSLADMQLKKAGEQNLKQQMAAMASQRGGNPALAARQAANMAAEQGQNIAAQSSQMRLQEQRGAQEQLAGLTQAARGQDIGLATDQARLDQSGQIADQAAQLKAQGLTDAQVQSMLQGAAGIDLAQFKAPQELEALKSQQALGYGGIEAQMAQAGAAAAGQQTRDILGAVGTGLGAYAALSDKNLKTDIKPANDKLEALMKAAAGSEFSYKDPEKFGAAKRIGPMAQNLEKSELGRDMVLDTPEGKMVDYNQPSTFMAMASLLNEKIDTLESQLAKSADKRKKKGGK